MVSGSSTLLGLLGWPVSHSFSPAMHNAAAAALGLDVAYVPLAVAPGQVGAAVGGLRALGFRGANVTIPHKQTVIPYLDRVDEAARIIGAVNTITHEAAADGGPGQLLGSNTDHAGFLADLRAAGFEPAGRDCLILGSGGSARAVAYALLGAGAAVTLTARRLAPAAAIAADLAALPGRRRPRAILLSDLRAGSGADLVVNTTPVGMHPQESSSPWPAGFAFPRNAFCYDLIYSPARTRLMQQAAAAGGQIRNGLGMLVRQGALSFERWLGLAPDLAVMEAAARAAQQARKTRAE